MDSVYKRAEMFLPWNLEGVVLNCTLFPYWSNEALYYFQNTSDGRRLIKVDIETGAKEIVFDIQELVVALSIMLDCDIDSIYLPLDGFSIQEAPLKLNFIYNDSYWTYDINNKACVKNKKNTSTSLISPDGSWSISINDHDLVLTNAVRHQQYQITHDGEHHYNYSSSPETNTRTISQRLSGAIVIPVAIWSPDSKKIITHKLDQRKVKSLSLLQSAPKNSQRPVSHSYKMSFSGDTDLPLAELIVIDILTKQITYIKTEPLLCPYLSPLELKYVWWSKNCNKIYFIREARGSKELMLCVSDATSGITETLITEIADTYAELSHLFLWPSQVIILEDRREIIWLSERSGYAHIYLYDIGSNVPKNRITQGEWCVKEIHFYDEKTHWLYFTASGVDKDVDPYYKQLFRCRLDGSEFQCLTKENADHMIAISPQRHCFLDTYSTINTASSSVLKTMEGKFVSCLEIANIQGLEALNWTPPERFCLKARDGLTSIYGNLYFPSNFDPKKTYPIIDHIYPGPQIYRTPTAFTIYEMLARSAWTAQALAELGFIVIHVDGFGTPGRSKAFHDVGYQNMSDFSIPDHVSVITQLTDKYPFIDSKRIGITGFSAGAYAAVRAMLMYPDFFKVGVAASGNHDLRCYPASYGEKYNGIDDTTYAEQSNVAHAEKLQGKLLLIHGDMDDNVHPCATLQLVNALIEHNKDFDMLIMPNQNHKSTFDHPYYMRRHWDYFIRNLLNEIPPINYRIKQVSSFFPQVIHW